VLTLPGESRTDLIDRNRHILRSVINDMKPLKKSAILLLVANPVDILTYFALEFSGLPKQHVIGSGTYLDSARLRGAIAAKAGVAASSIDAYVLGEHGESQVVSGSRQQELHLSVTLLISQTGRMVMFECLRRSFVPISRHPQSRPRRDGCGDQRQSSRHHQFEGLD
jgi:malate/lactate dehydrogenase